MKAHSLQVLSTCHLGKDPEDPMEAVPKQYLEKVTMKGLFITDITPTSAGIVALKEYHAGTTPADFLLSKATTNTAEIRVHFLAEPESTLFNIGVQVNGVDAQHIEQHPQDTRLYRGYADITVDDQLLTETITAVASTGAEVTCDLDILIGAPDFSSAILGDLPGAQTEVKQGDVVPISGTVGNDAVEVKVINFGASGDEHVLTLGEPDSAGAGLRTFDGSITVSGRSGTYTAQVVSKNILGTESEGYNTSNQIVLNQTHPSISSASFAYPAGQQAIKDSESVDVTVTVGNADSVDYTTASGLSVNDPSVYGATKTVTRSSEAIQYAINTDNYTITATKASNGAVTVKSFAVKVVNIAATADVVILGGSTLRSSAAGETYTIEVRPDQPLLGAPDSLTATAGEFVGSWQQSGNNWRHGFRVLDTAVRGDHTFGGLSITGLSGIVSSTIDSGDQFRIAGFVQRDVIVPALSQLADLGVNVFDATKVVVYYKGADELTYRAADLAQFVKGFSITDDAGTFDANGDHVFLTDAAFAGTNTTGTLTLTVEETI